MASIDPLDNLLRAIRREGPVYLPHQYEPTWVRLSYRGAFPDDWADGSNGYLKKSFVIDAMQRAGFEFVGESDINTNDRDRPTTEDAVWRLPPAYQGTGDDPEQRARVDEIGESNRMTLKFRKPD